MKIRELNPHIFSYLSKVKVEQCNLEKVSYFSIHKIPQFATQSVFLRRYATDKRQVKISIGFRLQFVQMILA